MATRISFTTFLVLIGLCALLKVGSLLAAGFSLPGLAGICSDFFQLCFLVALLVGVICLIIWVVGLFRKPGGPAPTSSPDSRKAPRNPR